MNRTSDLERLLADVLAEPEEPRFRETLLGETLRYVGRRRRLRRLRNAGSTFAVAGVAALTSWIVFRNQSAGVPANANYALVRTQSLPSNSIVATQTFAPMNIAASVASVELIHTSPASRWLHNINDDELLALLAPRTAALVRTGPNSEKLIFVSPSDGKDLPLN